ncbi:MAG: peptidylprolyl isomerase [Candidatus Omnitrophota bacterium]
MKRFIMLAVIGLILTGSTCFAKSKDKGEKEMTIQNGKEVAINYTLTVDDQVIDTSKDRGPLTYVQGSGQIIQGLDKALEGLKAGDKKSVIVTPEEGYGNIDPAAFQEVPKSELPSEIEPQVGMALQAGTPDGRTQIMRISEIKDDIIVVDMNHPLAGKTLNFDVEIVSVK